jgi:ATP-binding cassette, subfamily B, bacterial CvaB/MchF/RaxB
MKVIVQSQIAECGLASLAMVADYHGYKNTLQDLRRRFSLSLKGASLKSVMSMAQSLGFQTRALRLEMEDVTKLKTPCILHWDLNHFVALAKVTKNHVTIHDPASGIKKLTYEEASKHFTGVALELTPGVEFKKQNEPASVSISQLTGSISGLWPSLIQILLLSIALQVFVLLSPFFMQWVIDQALVSADRNLLTVLGLGFGIALILQIAIGVLRSWSVVYLSTRLGFQWMGNVFAHTLKLPLDFFEKRHLGDVVSRMSAVQAIQRTLTTSALEAVIDGLMAVATVIMMLIYSWKLALITFAAVILYLGIRALAFKPVRSATEQQLVAGSKQQSHLLESLRGIQSVKVSGQEVVREASYQNLMVDTINQELRIARMGLSFNTASQLVFGLERIIVIWLGASLAMQSIFSVGMLIAYLAYKDQFAMRIAGLIDKWIEFRMLRLHGERLADIVLTEPEKDSGSDFEMAAPVSTKIMVENLGFRYADSEPWVLKDLNFTVTEGESVAIVGASGCGKTTLIKLMLGLLQPTEGTMSVGGHDIRKLGVRNYRALVGAVMQDDQLFAGSVAENIAFGDENFDMARIEAAAKLAAVHDEITAMPMGYYSLIGDMGTTLSGGQKQRVVLARALYRNPQILFLDEATSHLDVERERMVNDAVRQLKLIKIIIAHRPETIASADRVLVMQGGKIVQEYQPKPASVKTLTEVNA